MALGIELLFNMRTNSKMFNDSINSASSAADKFYKGFELNLKETQGKLNLQGSTLESFKKVIKQATPIAVNFQDALEGKVSKGEQFVLSRALEGAANKVDSLNKSFQNFFGQGLDSKKLQSVNKTLLDMGAHKYSKLTDSIEKFTTDLGKFSPKQQKRYVDLLKELRNPKDAKQAAKLTTELKKISDLPMKDVTSGFNNLIKSTQRWLAYGLGLGSMQQIFSQIMSVQTDMSRTVWQMGKVSSKAFNTVEVGADGALKANMKLRSDVRDTTQSFMEMDREIATGTQSSLSEVAATMGELMKMRVGSLNGDFKELANTSMLMQKGLGMSASAANNFVRDLSLVGGVGAKDVKAAAQQISNVQQNLGLTEGETQLVGATVGKLMRQFRTFGGSAKDVAAVTKEVGKMTAAFSSVGLAAEDAQAMVSNMMNPDNLQKSVVLWSQMGMSASEGFAMMQGEGKNMVGMTEKMVHAAKNLKKQYGGNIFALKAMAEASGMTLEQVQALSQYDASRLTNMKKQAKLEEAAKAARQGINDQFKRLKDQLMVILQAILLPMLKVLGNFLEPLITIISKINSWSDSTNVLYKIFGKLGKIIIVVILLGIMGLLPKIISGFKLAAMAAGGIGKNLGAAKDSILGISAAVKNGAKTFASSWKAGTEAGMSKIGKLKSAIGDLFKKGSKVAGDVGNGAAEKISKGADDIVKNTKGADKGASGLEKIGKALKKFPDPKTVLAIGAAILLMAVGISMVILSITMLVKAVGKAQLGFKQLAGIAIVLLPVFAGFIGLLWGLSIVIPVLGAAGTVGAVGILAIGAAMLLMGVGIALVVLSIAKLVTSFGSLGEGAVAVAKGITTIVLSITALVGTATLFVLAMVLLAQGFVAAAIGAGLFLVSLVVLMTAIPMLVLLGLAANKVGQAILNMGTGAKLMADNFGKAVSGLKDFKAELGGGWKKVVDQVVAEIERMNTALQDTQKLTSGTMSAVVTHIVAGKLSGENKAKSGAKTVDYTSQLNTTNQHLSTIATNTANTNKLLHELITETKHTGRVRTKLALVANTGAR